MNLKINYTIFIIIKAILIIAFGLLAYLTKDEKVMDACIFMAILILIWFNHGSDD